MTTMTTTMTPRPVPPRYFVRTVGSRYHVVDTVTGYTVAAYWTLAEAVAARNTVATTH